MAAQRNAAKTARYHLHLATMLGLRVQAARGAKCYGYLCFCSCRHILITFVGMTLLIVSYGVNTVQMSAEPTSNEVVSMVDSSGSGSGSGGGSSRAPIMTGNYAMNGDVHLPPHTLATPQQEHDGGAGHGDRGHKALVGRFINLRKSRLFGLLGTNFSLAYNLTIGTGSTTAANITVVAAPAPAYYYAPAPAYYYAPAPAYYYAPAPAYYPYGYGYYNPYAYNGYAPSYYG